MLEDLTKTIKAQLYERVNSPLLASFTISWAIWNYRFIVVIFSSMETLAKFQHIDNSLYPSSLDILCRGVLFPLLTTLFLIFVYPLPAKFVYEHWRKRQRELKEVQLKIDDETPLTKEEAREIRAEALKESEEYEKRLNHQKLEIVQLKNQIETLEESLASPPKESKSDSVESEKGKAKQLNIRQLKMLQKVAYGTDNIAADDITMEHLIEGEGRDLVRSQYDYEELEKQGYIKKSYNNGEYLVNLTPFGRAYLVKMEDKLDV